MHGGDGGGGGGGHHGGGFGGHHHGGGFGGQHHHQGDQGGMFIPPGAQPPRPRGPWGGPRSMATRYIAFGAFVVVFLVLLFALH